MKVVQWYPKDVPEDIEWTDDGQWCFEDWPTQFDLEEGDMIQMISNSTQWGTRCYHVINVLSLSEDFDGYCQRSLVLVEE